MIHSATFKGYIATPQFDQLQVSMPKEAKYEVQVYEKGSPSREAWRARIVGSGSLPVKASASVNKVKAQVEGLFRERITEWREE